MSERRGIGGDEAYMGGVVVGCRSVQGWRDGGCNGHGVRCDRGVVS